MRAQADYPVSQDDRQPVSVRGVPTHPGGPRRPQRGVPSPHADTVVSITLRITLAFTLVPFCLSLPSTYIIIKDVVTDQYLSRCCSLSEDQCSQLQSVYPETSSPPTINETACLAYLPRCVLYTKERVECLKMRGRYGSNVFSLLEPRDSFTVYKRKQGPGRVICRNDSFSWGLAVVICILYGILLANYCFCIVLMLYMISTLSTLPRRGANNGSAPTMTIGTNTRHVVT
ncbi:hypothetical protein MTO96_051934 [Rhipicephalus appendiculatus]